MGSLNVDAAYLASLAAKQEEAAAALKQAGENASGLASLVGQTHGSVCSASVAALRDAEQALTALVAAMQTCSARLEEKLLEAQNVYHRADIDAF